MKLDELLGIRRFKNLKPGEAAHLLATELGGTGTKLATGSHGIVMLNKDTVFKFWLADSSYEAFIEEVQKHQHNPFFPKLKSRIKTLKIFNNGEMVEGYDLSKVKYIKMEILKPVKNNIDIFDDISLIRILRMSDTKISKMDLYEQIDLLTEYKWRRDADKVEIIDQIYELMVSLNNLLSSSETRRLDLHSGNFMKRGDQLVCTDPVFDQNTFKLNKMILDLYSLPTSVFMTFKVKFDEYIKKHDLRYLECKASGDDVTITDKEFDTSRRFEIKTATQMMVNPEIAFDSIYRRFSFVEPCIATSAKYSYMYAVEILNDRFELGEPAIYADPRISADYTDFLKDK